MVLENYATFISAIDELTRRSAELLAPLEYDRKSLKVLTPVDEPPTASQLSRLGGDGYQSSVASDERWRHLATLDRARVGRLRASAERRAIAIYADAEAADSRPLVAEDFHLEVLGEAQCAELAGPDPGVSLRHVSIDVPDFTCQFEEEVPLRVREEVLAMIGRLPGVSGMPLPSWWSSEHDDDPTVSMPSSYVAELAPSFLKVSALTTQPFITFCTAHVIVPA